MRLGLSRRGNVKGAERIGQTYLHSMADGHSGVAEFFADGTALTRREFTRREIQWFDGGASWLERPRLNHFTDCFCPGVGPVLGVPNDAAAYAGAPEAVRSKFATAG